MRINRALVVKVRRMQKLAWNNQAWHAFMGQLEVEAIQYGLKATKGMPYREYKDIILEAKNYYNLNLILKGKS